MPTLFPFGCNSCLLNGLGIYGLVCSRSAVYRFFERDFMTQNIIFVLAFLAVVWRICTRKMTNVEWWLVAFVVMSIFLVQLQMFIGEDGKLSWILRYHQAALVFLYGWAAWGVVSLADRLSGKWRMGFVVVVGAWIVGTGGTSLWRIAKQAFVDSSRSARARAAEWAAEIIQKDFSGPLRDKERFFTLQEYHPSNRPIILADGAYLVSLVGGRWVSTSRDIHRYEHPDYALLTKEESAPTQMTPVAETEIGKKKRGFVLYRADKFWQPPKCAVGCP